MQRRLLQRYPGNRKLVLMFLGWAATPADVAHIPFPAEYDVLVCHGYRTRPMAWAAEEFAGYEQIYLFAWSFGVWVAEQCCPALPLRRAVALNGTPFPVSEEYGMRLRPALRAARAMLRTAPEPGLPTPQERLDEITRLAAWAEECSAARLRWDAALLADADEMFPPARLQAYWQPLGVAMVYHGTHNPFDEPKRILDWLDA
ncbi:MAG: DUF452 family protein [Akkermansia sp.]|nr:DUF452 family protein [Akkermansia sp.]